MVIRNVIQYNKFAICGLSDPVLSSALFVKHAKKLEGSGYEIGLGVYCGCAHAQKREREVAIHEISMPMITYTVVLLFPNIFWPDVVKQLPD